MKSLATTISEIEGWLGSAGRPHPIWNEGWISDGGLIWDYPHLPLTREQVAALKDVELGHAWYIALERQRERTFRRIRRLASEARLTAYKTNLSCVDVSSTFFEAIVVAPLATQYDILRTESTQGNNHYRSTKEIIKRLLSFDQKYGIIISGADDRVLEFWFRRLPKGQQAQEVGERLLQLAPDILEAPMDFHSCVALGWD